MRFLLIGLNYLPESTSIGPYTASLAEYLHAKGHHVCVVTGFPIAPQWRVWEGYRGRWFMREMINGLPVLRTFLYVPAQPKRTLQRVLFDFSFAVSSLVGGLFAGPADLIVVISPPLQLGLTGWLLSLVKHAPYFIHIQDLVPDAAVVTGMLRESSLAVRLARALERFVYSRARGIGVISEGFARNLISKGVRADKATVLPNFIDLDFLRPMARDNDFRQQHGIRSDQFLVMYSGSIALKQGLHTLVEAAAEFRQGDDVAFYIVGEGPYLQDLKAKADEFRLANVHFLPLQSRADLPAQLAAADALVITQKRAVTDVVFPGKLLYYMAAGRPILAAVSADSETGRFVSNSQVGVLVPPEEPCALAQAIRRLQQNRCETERLGHNSRRVVEEKFDQRLVLARFAEHLENLRG